MVSDHEIKILKAKPWMIKFSFDGQDYFIKEVDDEDCLIHFYKFECDNVGRYRAIFLNSSYGTLRWFHLRKGQTYRDYDEQTFIDKLIEYGFNPGYEKEEFEMLELNMRIHRIEEMMLQYQKEIKERHDKINILLKEKNNLMVRINEKNLSKV